MWAGKLVDVRVLENWVHGNAAVRSKRVGRLLHPYLTRVQQRYALYTQRQALPRVPPSAVPPTVQGTQKTGDGLDID